ncbi:MAG: Tat proofreading chaperone DmsD [Coriobacteriaceae bacterium]|nr:Tat proofreading chaperone DmsD [Coriobacteriaceae bacterium]
MCINQISEECLAGIAFVGRSLGPFFRYDPKREFDVIGPSYDAIMQLNAQEAAKDWPFADEKAVFRALCLMQEGLEDDLDEEAIIWEYRRLFVGPAHKAAPPWGSVYTDKDGVMFGGSWVALREWMRENGLAVAEGESREPEDHIGLMLEMMAWLAQERPELVGPFLQLHLLPWAGHFLARVEEVSQHPFFEGLARLTAASLSGIQAELGLEVDVPRFYR